jgi:hypothetical protein
MDVGDQMEAYLLQNKALGNGAKETDQYRALEEQWFNNYDLINGIIRGDTSIDKAVAALGGIKADGSITQANVEDVVKKLQSAIINGTDDTGLDFNSDGNVDSADYDALRMVIGDRRNESAFDALMTQDSLNLSKLGMYSGLAKNTSNVNAHDQAIYSKLENYYADQSEVNNYIATNTASSSFASAAEQQRFTELANQLDELNEAVEFNLRDKLFKNTPATINAELKAKADKASNEMVLLSLGLSKDDSATVAASFEPGFKITEALDGNVEAVLQLMAELKKDNKIDLKQLITVSKLLIEDEEYTTELAQFKKLGEYLAIGANTNEIKTYIKLAGNNASQESLDLLDNCICKGTNRPLTDIEENKFLDYLTNEANADIAKTYLSLVTGNDANKTVKLAALEALAANNATDKLNDTQEDVFLNYLTTEGNVNIPKTYADILNGNEADTIKTAKIAALAAFALGNEAISADQENKFLDYLQSSTTKIASTYLTLVKNNASSEKLQLLDEFAQGKYSLNETQENKMLDYLGGSKNGNIAKSYVNFVKNGATEKDYSTLDEIFKKSGSINQVVAPSDLKFTTNLESIKNEFRLNIDPKLLLKYLEKADISALNSITGNMMTNLTKSNDLQKTKTDTTNLLEDLTRVLMDPLTERLSTYKTEAAPVSKQILELQLKTLNTLDPNDPVVIKVKKSVNEQIKSLPDYLTDSDSATDGQSTAVKGDYAIFKKAFPAGKPPTAAQTAAALELINGNYILGDSPAFIANYTKFVSSGDTKSADKLMEIAKYFGANETYGSSLRQFSNAKLDAKSVEVASEILDFTKNLSAQNISDLRGPILVANRFMLDSVLNNKGGFNSATEGDLTKTFFKSLEEASKEKSSTVTNKELSEFLVSSIYSFSRDLYQDGKVQLISTTSLVQRDISNKELGPLAKDGIAQMQIDVFEGMLSFYQSQVQGENAKPEPDASKISQWQAQINSHQSAITALQRTLS